MWGSPPCYDYWSENTKWCFPRLACNVALLRSKCRHNSRDFEYWGQYSWLVWGGIRYSSEFYHILLSYTPVFDQKFSKIFHLSSKFFVVINPPCLNDKRDWLVQEQTALGKDISNPFIAYNLLKIVWFLNSPSSSKDNELASPQGYGLW